MIISQQMFDDRLSAERQERLGRIKRAWEYYEGKHRKQLDVDDGDYDDNVVVNLARPIVDKGISFLFGKDIGIQVDETSTQDTAVEVHIKKVLKENRKMSLLHDAGQNGALSGMVFIKIDPRPTGLRLLVLESENVSIFNSASDISDIYQFRIEYTAPDKQGREVCYRQDITRDGDIGTNWTIRDYEAIQGKRYELKKETAWNYSWPPVVYCKNLPHANATWGYGDLDGVSLQDALNLIASTVRRILRLHGHPQTILFGADAQGLERGPGNMWTIENQDARAENLEMQSDLAAAEAFYKQLRQAIYTSSRMPDIANYTGNLGALTNFGLRVLFADFLEKNETKRLLYGEMIETLCTRIAELGGYGPDVHVKLSWPDPLPSNGVDKANEVVIKQGTGLVSDETLTQELGYSYADEQQRLKAEGHIQPPSTTATTSSDPTTNPDPRA